jgi:hypothetical protein
MKLTVKDVADFFNQKLWRRGITPKEIKLLQENNLVVVYGYSDSVFVIGNVKRFRAEDIEGIDDIVTIYIDKTGYFCDEYDERVEIFKDIFKNCTEIKAFMYNDPTYVWKFDTTIPHETFDIYDQYDNVKYCKAIIFSLEDLI